ncbi:hypothetical protein EVAR_88086_1 [Eumeta japonica]|uniref:Uncharacterized protein n=1 Tax=Eumeta variegata TaxID=151549 RepID=A0A4C1WHC1_EUMVA|nr:hypothetical protein EVAR_88086_1 [Eumeta japonica]
MAPCPPPSAHSANLANSLFIQILYSFLKGWQRTDDFFVVANVHGRRLRHLVSKSPVLARHDCDDDVQDRPTGRAPRGTGLVVRYRKIGTTQGRALSPLPNDFYFQRRGSVNTIFVKPAKLFSHNAAPVRNMPKQKRRLHLGVF